MLSLLVFQVNITWEDILQEEHNKGIFEMELEDWDDDMDNVAKAGTKVNKKSGLWDIMFQLKSVNTFYILIMGKCLSNFQLPMENGVLKGNAYADKLDGLMVIVCEHLKLRADSGHLLNVSPYRKIYIVF